MLFRQIITIFLLACGLAAKGQDRPNILWITAEDMSATLGCYGDKYASTPNIDALATESERYTLAFASAPVCSPSRSCLITGCYAPSLGTHNMRSAFPIPKAMTGFPSLLRKVGYYTSNNVKTDYNTANYQEIINASWNESSGTAHFNQRKKKGDRFFSVFNLMTSHQSRTMVWPHEKFVSDVQSMLSPGEIHDPKKAPLPPYYVDTPVVRKTVARFYDSVTAMDKQVGQILEDLKKDGQADNTIVFFYSDHGSGMPRHKRALLDSGMHVPLMIRFPEKWQHLASGKPGSTQKRLVSFVDFGPTVLSLAGVDIPDAMQGKPFLGKQAVKPRTMVFGHRDRVDEVRDMARSVRDKRYLYIRNFMPHLGYNQYTGWPDLGEIRHEFYRLTDEQKMSAAQWHFAGPARPVEELYDCQKDPLNLKNLATDPKHKKTLGRMRKALAVHIRESKDYGFIPETIAWQQIKDGTAWELLRSDKARVRGANAAAAKVGVGKEEDFLKNLASKSAAIRYWGLIGLAGSEKLSPAAMEKLAAALQDKSITVRIEAASALARHGRTKQALPVLLRLLKNRNMNNVLHAARAVELIGDKSTVPAMKALLKRCHKIRPPEMSPVIVASGEQDLAMFTSLSIGGFLKRVDK
ncbi:MAG: sulfatase-like hydrolase/transferase [Limisphaerales bacterium]